jgi:hypothetical protein
MSRSHVAGLAIQGPGRAICNGLAGERSFLLDPRLQYVHSLPGNPDCWSLPGAHNALNTITDANRSGERNHENLLIQVEAGPVRAMQLGIATP